LHINHYGQYTASRASSENNFAYFSNILIFSSSKQKNTFIFELFKIISDWYDQTHHQTFKFMYHEHNYSISWVMYVLMIILLVVIQIISLPKLFHYDAYLMFGFMVLRSLKQIYKKRL